MRVRLESNETCCDEQKKFNTIHSPPSNSFYQHLGNLSGCAD